MAVARTAKAAVDRIRKWTAAGTGQWSDTELLAALEETLEGIWTQTNSQGRDHNLDSVDLLTTDADSPTPDLVRVTPVSGCYEFEPPEYMGPIRALEHILATSPDQSVPIPTTTSLRFARGFLTNYPQQLAWYRAAQDKLRIHGLVTNPKVRVWFLRRWPPLHFGTVQVPGTTTQATLAATAGRTVARSGWYVGSRIEWITGNPDALVRVTGTAAPATPLVVNFTPAVTVPVAPSHQYSLVLPCDPEHADYAILSTALRLIGGRDGNAPQAEMLRSMAAEAREAFIADLAERDMARQRRPHNSRTYR